MIRHQDCRMKSIHALRARHQFIENKFSYRSILNHSLPFWDLDRYRFRSDRSTVLPLLSVTVPLLVHSFKKYNVKMEPLANEFIKLSSRYKRMSGIHRSSTMNHILLAQIELEFYTVIGNCYHQILGARL